GPGRIFVPLPGTRADGHAFVAPALAAGAVAAFCSAGSAAEIAAQCTARGIDPAGRLLAVPDPARALDAWARARRADWSGELVGLCGSNGKTTTKEMLASILARRAPTGRTEGNLNNQLGVPVTLTRLAAAERYAVVEIGMNHAGEVRALGGLAQPTAGMITNVAPEHLEGLGTLDDVARAEAEIGETLPPGAPLVIPGDDLLLAAAVSPFPVRRVTFALAPGAADFVATDLVQRGEAGATFRVAGFPPLSIPLPGVHSVKNALAALATAHVLGLTPGEIAAGLEAMERPAGRTEIARAGGVTLLLDHYNANPASLDAALDLLEGWPGGGRRFAALGDMLELGPTADTWHAAAGRRLPRLDGAFLWGPLMVHAAAAARAAGGGAAPGVRHFADRRALGQALAALLGPGDVVLVKGSRGSAMEDVIEVLRSALGDATAAAGEGR
ncbi:MAG: UDP-N-acetylmuramoyl-tripeptide--D-alanyl-D-alanine ligase, partial [Candidatus Eisenbacteria bacterium]